MERGYLKLWRRSLDCECFHNPELWRLWSWCLMKTSYKPRFVPFITGKGKLSVKVEAGQFIFGRNKAAEFLGDSPSTVWKRMKKLELLQNITIQSNKQYSIVTICNWEEYQEDDDSKVTGKEQASDKQVTTEEQLSDTNKKVKKDKKDKKTTTPIFDVIPYRPDWISEQDWNDIILHRKKHPRKPPETERAYKGIIDQLKVAQSSGYSLAQCLDKWLNNSSWQTFKVEYMEGFNKPAPIKPAMDKRSSDALDLLSRLK